MVIISPAFENNGKIPVQYTCDGAGINPPLVIEDVPEVTKSLVLIVDDPDAPINVYVHWLVWNIPANIHEIEEDSVPSGAVQGTNSSGQTDYVSPCPPNGTHRYYFKIYALDTELDLTSDRRAKDLEEAIASHIIDKAVLVGTYTRVRN